ncbi:glycogen synthase GlgA [Gynuella sunshinyii]|uniref:Glycogen synthase n=1 Tax=Gynuella sunshinyii YC6258 TaxID=1445510 RepID=A0A0C5VVH6_9GAMM|nr:glycogen synthase GlgA [Gynuella sunshinyii]AJQ94469.1 glycogen synthase [Gynuella sunshinyii YC6258]
MRVLFLASEMDGLVKTGGLADVARALPEQLVKKGVDVRVVIPCYRPLLARNFPVRIPQLETRLNHFNSYFSAIRETEVSGVTVYLIEHNHFFDREGLYFDEQGDFGDNAIRFALLCKAALDICDVLSWYPDIIHCNDWQTALTPLYLKEHLHRHPGFTHTRTLLSIHNGLFQGHAPGEQRYEIGMHPGFFTSEVFEDHGKINLLKGGIVMADAVCAVSPGYRNELLSPEGSHGLWMYYGRRRDSFHGILNGCDYNSWNPEVDAHISATFSASDISGKHQCKHALQQQSGLQVNPDIPVLGIVSRLTDQKGFQFLLPALQELLHHQDSYFQIVALGSGNQDFSDWLTQLATDFPDRVHFTHGYNEPLSHQIEAGADFFLMPSAFEPCGLNQIYSLKYGTLPIVRATGGLQDTVVGLDDHHSNLSIATGFSFAEPSAEACKQVILKALGIWQHHRDIYNQMQHRAMEQDFSWDNPVQQYLDLYSRILTSAGGG